MEHFIIISASNQPQIIKYFFPIVNEMNLPVSNGISLFLNILVKFFKLYSD